MESTQYTSQIFGLVGAEADALKSLNTAMREAGLPVGEDPDSAAATSKSSIAQSRIEAAKAELTGIRADLKEAESKKTAAEASEADSEQKKLQEEFRKDIEDQEKAAAKQREDSGLHFLDDAHSTKNSTDKVAFSAATKGAEIASTTAVAKDTTTEESGKVKQTTGSSAAST